MKRKATKRTLLFSALCLILCIAMLLGTTYAWFTDSVTSSGNIIKSGNLNIKASWAEKIDGTYTDVEQAATGIFNYQNWEPGYTEVKYIKLENAGSLAFEYELDLLPHDSTATTLAEVLEVYYLTPAQAITDRALTGMLPVGTLNAIMANNIGFGSGVLLPAGQNVAGYPAGEIIIAVALHMQESAGNDYMNQSVGNGFDLRVRATQFTHEDDSFNKNYDAGSTYASVVYNANGGSGTMATQNFTVGTAQTLTPNTFTRSGYEFGGWNTKADGSGTAYRNGEQVSLSQNVVLYAQWLKIITEAKLNFNSAFIPAQLKDGEVVSTLIDGAGGAAITVADNALGYSYMTALNDPYNYNLLWIKSDDDTASSSYTSTDEAVVPPKTYQAGKYYFLCATLEADNAGGYTFGNNVTVTDDTGEVYHVEHMKYVGLFDILRVYKYIGQAVA